MTGATGDRPDVRTISRIEGHPAYAIIAPLFQRYPSYAQPLWQTFTDLTLSQRWTHVDLACIGSSKGDGATGLDRPIVIGSRPGSKASQPAGSQSVGPTSTTTATPARSIVVPTLASERWTPARLAALFRSLDELSICPREETVHATSQEFSAWELIDRTPATGDPDVSHEIAKDYVFFAITDLDSSIVYYRVWKGIKKPKEWRDD